MGPPRVRFQSAPGARGLSRVCANAWPARAASRQRRETRGAPPSRTGGIRCGGATRPADPRRTRCTAQSRTSSPRPCSEIEEAGLYKRERELTTPAVVARGDLEAEALNFCANNYLGFADHPDVVAASRAALDEWGFGMASVRFICGTQTQHTRLEARLSQFLGTEATILYSSCFDANGGVFEVLFGAEDAIVSDELNHASIIDGIRLSKAARFRYKNADMADLRAQLEAARAGGARRACVVTDGVFSMDGSYAPLDEICDLADEFEAMVLVDDSHAVGFVGDGGRGTPELFGVMDRVDIVTGTLGKALGGASGGYVASHREVVDLLRQRSRPYLFSNSVAPAVVAGSLAALDLVSGSSEARETLEATRRSSARS